jgi:triosephosphate isomerase (TIM)
MLIVGNWKMQLTHVEALAWLKEHTSDLATLLQTKNNTLVLCPSFTEIPSISSLLASTPILWGAQDCAAVERGAYTGDISVLSLKELGCSYCIIGHSDRRLHYGETNEIVAKKALLLMQHGIQPIICLGETYEQRLKGSTHTVIREQVAPILDLVDTYGFKRLSFAYEPVWAIGTGKVPPVKALRPVIEWLTSVCESYELEAQVLYGGSIQENNFADILIIGLDGFLLGKSSLDIKPLKTILSLAHIPLRKKI